MECLQPRPNIYLPPYFEPNRMKKCIQTKVTKRQRAQRDWLLPIVNVIHTVAFRDLKKPLHNLSAKYVGRTLCYAWFKWSECSEVQNIDCESLIMLWDSPASGIWTENHKKKKGEFEETVKPQTQTDIVLSSCWSINDLLWCLSMTHQCS